MGTSCARLENIFELNEDRLCGFGPQICDGAFLGCCANMRLEHQIELPRLSEVSTAAVWALLNAIFFHELIGAQVSLAGAAINHRIARILQRGQRP